MPPGSKRVCSPRLKRSCCLVFPFREEVTVLYRPIYFSNFTIVVDVFEAASVVPKERFK